MTNEPHPARSDRYAPPMIGGTSRKYPVGEHIATGLPRFTKFHKGEFVKKGPERGKPIVRTAEERDHIQKASNGRYQFDYRNDRARPFQSGDQYRE